MMRRLLAILMMFVAAGAHAQNKPLSLQAKAPDYPYLARVTEISGDVRLRLIFEKGEVKGIYAIAGDPILLESCAASAKTWRLSSSASGALIGVCKYKNQNNKPEVSVMPDDHAPSAEKNLAAAATHMLFSTAHYSMNGDARLDGSVVLRLTVRGGVVKDATVIGLNLERARSCKDYALGFVVEPADDQDMIAIMRPSRYNDRQLEIHVVGADGSSARYYDPMFYAFGENLEEIKNAAKLRYLKGSTAEYPAAAVAARVQGEVTLKVAVRGGRVIAAHVEKGPQELRKSAQDAALSWVFMPSVYGVFTSTFTYTLGHAPTAEAKEDSPTHVVVMHE